MSTAIKGRPRVAVIAVHGVANQKPYDTVRTAAKMLARAAELVKKSGVHTAATYSAFEEHGLRISVNRVPTATVESDGPAWLGDALTYNTRSKTVTRRLDPASSSDGDMSLEYMTELLEPYEVTGEDSIYQTLRLESTRSSSAADVHVYEMYWADLSRFVGNWVRWLIEFYQLLFGLSILGKKSLGFARAQYEPQGKKTPSGCWRAWPVFSVSQVTADHALALFIPVLNFYLLGVALSVAPLLITPDATTIAVEGFITLALSLGIAFAIYFKRTWLSQSGRGWPGLLALPLVALTLGFILDRGGIVHPEQRYLWLMLAWWPLPLLAILWSMAAYQKRRSGAFPTALLVGVGVTAAYLYELSSHHGNAREVMAALLYTSEWILGGMAIAWSVLFIASLVMTLSGTIAPLCVPKGADRNTARRAAWTANLTLVLPGLLVFIVNLTLWQALILVTVPGVNSTPSASSWVKTSELWQAQYIPCAGSALCHSLFNLSQTKSMTAVAAVHELFRQSQTALYCVGLLLFSLAAVLLVWAIVPAAVAEVWARRKRSVPTDRRTAASSWLGESLSAGFRAMRVSGEVVRWVFVAVIPIGALIFWQLQSQPEWKIDAAFAQTLDRYNSLALFVGGWLVLALIAAKGPFRGIALGLSSALDVALDVINWLRIRPVKSNPRARICARFYSLLRHIDEWRPADGGEGYTAVVILSHSQGTVITADLLRYLRSRDLSPRLPIFLFTMGCPLRQLYERRFPHLYGWAGGDGTTWPCAKPHPEDIGVAGWVNAYTSGDYVGRYLWFADATDASDKRWALYPVEQRAGGKGEFCIGAGAHTHYWDDSAPEIAIELDQLVGLVTRINFMAPSEGRGSEAGHSEPVPIG